MYLGHTVFNKMQNFATKRNALFACLDDASKEIKGTTLDQGDKPLDVLKRNKTERTERNLSFLRGKESIFKKPERPITRCLKARQTPDYQVNPHKWMKYSLSDVDISDHTNTAAAFAFLKQMDDQREDGQGATESNDEQKIAGGMKIEFKRSSKLTRNIRAIEASELADAEVDKPKLKGSKLIMPEYIIGQKPPKKEKKLTGGKIGESRAAGTLKLSHLQEMDDDDKGVMNDDAVEEESER